MAETVNSTEGLLTLPTGHSRVLTFMDDTLAVVTDINSLASFLENGTKGSKGGTDRGHLVIFGGRTVSPSAKRQLDVERNKGVSKVIRSSLSTGWTFDVAGVGIIMANVGYSEDATSQVGIASSFYVRFVYLFTYFKSISIYKFSLCYTV